MPPDADNARQVQRIDDGTHQNDCPCFNNKSPTSLLHWHPVNVKASAIVLPLPFRVSEHQKLHPGRKWICWNKKLKMDAIKIKSWWLDFFSTLITSYALFSEEMVCWRSSIFIAIHWGICSRAGPQGKCKKSCQLISALIVQKSSYTGGIQRAIKTRKLWLLF